MVVQVLRQAIVWRAYRSDPGDPEVAKAAGSCDSKVASVVIGRG